MTRELAPSRREVGAGQVRTEIDGAAGIGEAVIQPDGIDRELVLAVAGVGELDQGIGVGRIEVDGLAVEVHGVGQLFLGGAVADGAAGLEVELCGLDVGGAAGREAAFGLRIEFELEHLEDRRHHLVLQHEGRR